MTLGVSLGSLGLADFPLSRTDPKVRLDPIIIIAVITTVILAATI